MDGKKTKAPQVLQRGENIVMAMDFSDDALLVMKVEREKAEVQTGYCQVEAPKESEDEMLDRLLAARGWVAMPREEADRLNEASAQLVEEWQGLEKAAFSAQEAYEAFAGFATPRGLSVVAENPMGARMGTACWKVD